MKGLLTITTLFLTTFCLGQTIEGTVVDGETKEPLSHINIIVQGTTRGTVTDSIGKFRLDITKGDTLVFAFIGFPNHQIVNIDTDNDTVEIGEVRLLFSGASGYAMCEKKRFLSKKTKHVCKYFDNTKDIKPADLIVKCPDGTTNYTWTINNDKTLQVDFKKMKNCAQQ